MQTRKLPIAYGSSCFAKKWSNKTIAFEELCRRLENTVRTPETAEEYPKLPKNERERIKDKGGFVGGVLRDGRRKRESVVCRSMITLDSDHATPDLIEKYKAEAKYASALYTTHGHTPEAPRARIIVPLTRDVTPDEFLAISRYYADEWGIDQFDPCSYRSHQLMYWPSTPSNGEFIFFEIDENWLDPDEYLRAHPNWLDCAQLPTSSKESVLFDRERKHQKDPLTKEGLVGAFNNVHFPIQDYLLSDLADIYEPTADPNRFGFKGSDSIAGVRIYDDKYVYSHHASDPAYGLLLNAFDLTRIHRFGFLDDKDSIKEMFDFVRGDAAVKEWVMGKRLERADEEFSVVSEDVDDTEQAVVERGIIPLDSKPDTSWMNALELERNGTVKDTLENLVIIMECDPKLNCIGYNELKSNIDFLSQPPWIPIKYPAWTDIDASQLRAYLSRVYGIYSPTKTQDALNKVAAKRKHHPIRDYLNSLPAWDGTPRVDTLLVDYLGAENVPYTRAVTRKTLVAAVTRIYVPGIKFDSILVLDGPQAKGKSTLFNRLASDEWFNDGLTLTDMQDKAGAEKLQGYWILEIGELTGMRKSDIDSVKSFITRRDDKYRASYGRVVESHPRQCIIVATVNSTGGFLRDPTGNRRFWPVKTPGSFSKNSWELDANTVQQIWAEAKEYWQQGEELYLKGEVNDYAIERQNEAIETDEREGLVRNYLERLLPADWSNLDLGRRRSFLNDAIDGAHELGVSERTSVCPLEIWSECYQNEPKTIRKQDSHDISVILRKLGWVCNDERSYIPLYGRQRIWRKR